MLSMQGGLSKVDLKKQRYLKESGRIRWHKEIWSGNKNMLPILGTRNVNDDFGPSSQCRINRIAMQKKKSEEETIMEKQDYIWVIMQWRYLELASDSNQDD